MLYQWDVADRVCKDHPLEPQTSLTPLGEHTFLSANNIELAVLI